MEMAIKRQRKLIPILKNISTIIFIRATGKFLTSLLHGKGIRTSYRDSAQFIRAQKWFAIDGDHTLRIDYPLYDSSVVFDLGGYKGEWSKMIYDKYAPSIYVFEVHPVYANAISKLFEGIDKVKVYDFGLSGSDGSGILNESDDASSVYIKKGNIIPIRFREMASFIGENGIERIDLIKINIEGGEYDLLEHMIDSGLISKVDNLQIQFHDFVPHWKERMTLIQQKLSSTHELTYNYPLIWENWRIINPRTLKSNN